MGTSYNPKIVTDKLVFNLDFGNKKSYLGSGTICTNLTRDKSTGSLVNGASYNNSNGGSLSFNGTNQYINFNDNSLNLDLSDKSFQCWINKSGIGTNQPLIDKDKDIAGVGYGGWGFWIQSNNKLWWWNHSSLDLLDDGSLSISTGVWTNVAVSWDKTAKSASFYINGILNSTKSNGGINEVTSSGAYLSIGAMRMPSGTPQWYFNGSISQVIMYNKAMSSTEILQNYNATKGRFGL